MTTVHQIVYASSATRRLSAKELLELLMISRRKNIAVGITGLLVHRQSHFLQLVEGAEDDVRSLVHRIRQDVRHDHFTVLADREVSSRWFPEWSMGFEEVDQIIPGPGVSDFLARPFSPGDWAARIDEALAFFESCRQGEAA